MQEIKENVKVAVRVRPVLAKERLGGEQICVRIVSNSNQLILGNDKAFTFDHVISSKSTQDEVYKLCVEPLVQSIFDGYNATVFAYGQTGSGKTYTIGGGDITTLTEDEYGIIPRALKNMFYMMNQNKLREYTIGVSYIEIYMEELRDLLNLSTPSKDLHVREDSKGNTVITGACEIECESLDEVMSLLESGSAARHTGSTNMNEHSSRSHSIFTVVVGQKWTDPDSSDDKQPKPSDSTEDLEEDINHCMSGKFSFVDLAGSERAHKTGNIGDRFKESIYINSGLLSLGNVISALGDGKKKSTHIPYRESKITRLLKDSLGGNSKTLMICCISPAASNFDESLNALKYANRAKNIRNKPIINRDIQSIRFEAMQCEIKALREELARQRTTVMSHYGDKDVESVRELEEKISKLQKECSQYRLLADDAYTHILEILENLTLSKSHSLRLQDWVDLLEKIKKEVSASENCEQAQNETIRNLQSELDKCRSDLASDETIFAEKAREVNTLTETIKDMENKSSSMKGAMDELTDQCQKQAEHLISQQIRIDELEAALKCETSMNVCSDNRISTVSNNNNEAASARRPKSVPALTTASLTHDPRNLRPPSRLIKTSPALFTLERVMQSFRARSQLLVSRLEDSDEVLHQTFSDDHDEGLSQDKTFQQNRRRNTKVQRRGTFNLHSAPLEKDSNENQTTVSTSYQDESHTARSSGVIAESDPSKSSDFYQESRLINMDVQSSAEIQRKLIKQSQLRALEANQKIRDLSINIRMKEQLIRELVKSGKDAELMNKQYAEKIKSLEKEKENAKKELHKVQDALHSLETDKNGSSNLQKLEMDYKKKIDQAKVKVSELQKKQRETEKVANFAYQHEKKISDLEVALDRMKQQQENLQRKLKEEVEQKSRLEKDMVKELQRRKDLEIKEENVQKILHRRNEELASAKRRLRSASGVLPPIASEEQDRLDEQRKWLDSEVEKVLEQRRQNEELEQELKKRENILSKKEAIIHEKSDLELKKMRSSQALNQDLLTVSSKLATVEQKIEEKKKELPETPIEGKSVVKSEIQALRIAREKLNKQKTSLDQKINDGKVLSLEEERRLIEMDEAIETLDAAIQYKNESIHIRQMEVRQSQQALALSEENLIERLNSLSSTEIRALLSRYFDKVIGLRDNERKLNLKCSQMEVKTDEQERQILELQGAVQRGALELDRKLTQQQRDYEQKMHLLMHQVAEGNRKENGVLSSTSKEKIQNLEKDLYYYKKTARDLKRKIKELLLSGNISPQVAEEAGLVFNSMQSIDSEASTPRPNNNHHPTHQPFHSALSRDVPIGRESLHADGEKPRKQRGQMSPHLRNHSSDFSSAPIKVSKQNLRQMTEEEISMRRSSLSSRNDSRTPRDSLEYNSAR